jgi:hypothetical protein
MSLGVPGKPSWSVSWAKPQNEKQNHGQILWHYLSLKHIPCDYHYHCFNGETSPTNFLHDSMCLWT